MNFSGDESGITMIEYILILTLIALVGIFSLIILGDALSSNINSIANVVKGS